jgi:2-C-methyl-D-erythritol 4-phosphate cytidylyltransferase/2-C-methyl-D-erythritol 2,4-cyclodiphosphate synthase
MRVSLIIAAGGLGKRFFGSMTPARRKHFADEFFRCSGKVAPRTKICLRLNDQPLVFHTIHAFCSLEEIKEIVFAVPLGSEEYFKQAVAGMGRVRIGVVRGGRTRAESVWNALKKTSASSQWVMVHDGARPLVEKQWVEKLLGTVRSEKIGGAILARKVVPTIKKAGTGGWIESTVDRSALYEAETPQLVRRKLLMNAYRRDKRLAFQATDEASLLESLGASVKVVCHEGWNPKITSFEDYRLVSMYTKKNGVRITRTGFGKDIHRLVEGRAFWLGGLVIPYEKGPLGHSDGDALLHAITDAVLGVTGRGDIGDWFSDRDPKNKGIKSSKMLSTVLADAAQRGWRLEHIDSVVILERPKLGKYKGMIRKRISELTGLDMEAVSVKAKTMEGLGSEGEGLAVSCEALVTMRRGGA